MLSIRYVGVTALWVVGWAASIAPAQAARIAVQTRTPIQQAMTAEMIVIGKVTEIEKEMSKATRFAGSKDKVDYQVAVIRITENLQGAKGLTNVRVGFLPASRPADPSVPQPNVRPAIRPIGPGFQQATLTPGQEGCFFLSKHHDGDFYVMQQWGQPLDKKAADFDKKMESVKKVVKVFENPQSALEAKDVADREFAASILVQKYRRYPTITDPTKKVTLELIDADESKLILTVLSGMEWGKNDPNGIGLQQTFYQLGLQPKDGWVQPKFVQGQDFNKIMGEAVSKWLKENADKYRIQRQVAK